MTRLNIQLPDDVKALAESRATACGHASLDSYVESLIRADAIDDLAGPEHLRADSQSKLLALLKESEQGEAREMTAADWDDLRRRLIERHGSTAKAG